MAADDNAVLYRAESHQGQFLPGHKPRVVGLVWFLPRPPLDVQASRLGVAEPDGDSGLPDVGRCEHPVVDGLEGSPPGRGYAWTVKAWRRSRPNR